MRANVGKTVGMICHPCQAAGNLSEAAYRRRVTGEGPTYRERLKGQISCSKYKEMLAAGSLSSHMMTKHGRGVEIRLQWNTPAAGTGPQTYRMTFLEKGGPRNYPVVGCLGRMATRTAMRVHFVHWHALDTMIVL